MPPGPAYNWFCVAYSVLNILSHAAHHRAAQVAQNTAARATTAVSSKSRQEEPSKEPESPIRQHYTPQGVQQSIEGDTIPRSTDHGLKSSRQLTPLVPNFATPSEDVEPLLHNDLSLDEPLHKVQASVGIRPQYTSFIVFCTM